ncbi:MAG: N-acetylmuramoyl-L-alanine amidase [Deltaproteobacteria bacterium]|nr:N-acetylmuramoyl-L-alanine amidase [Deltaproteobacteria bacterium]
MWAALLLASIVAAPQAGGGFVLALDAGHGGTNLGAAGVAPGFYEKRITLDIARRVKKRLSRHKGITVVLCRDKDELMPIRARVRCANDSHADLFLSLHTNASPDGASRGTQIGFEQYVLPVDNADREAALAAAQAPDAVQAAWEAHRVHLMVEASLEAAKRVQLELADALGTERDRGVKQLGASLDVLAGLQMPGILIEVGFIDHPDEGKELVSEDGQERIAAALARAVSDLAARAKRAHTDPNITGRAKGR